MRILILGGDGYLGWPTALSFSARGDEVTVVDNYFRRKLCKKYGIRPLVEPSRLPARCARWKRVSGRTITARIGDVRDFDFLSGIISECCPDAIIHYAQQPSAPFSMKGFEEARLTYFNNLETTFNLAWAVREQAPQAHIIKLGSMGEYGTPNIDIEEGWLRIEHEGRTDNFLFPRQGSSLYHTTKIHDTDLLWFYVRTWKLRVTDIMQGPVYGLHTDETEQHQDLLTMLCYDDVFGTVFNRFLVQAVAGVPLTVYGSGRQTRVFLNIVDVLRCLRLVADNPARAGELRIVNQFVEKFVIVELAERVKRVGIQLGLKVEIASLPNPRTESENHYYNPKRNWLPQFGFTPCALTDETLERMLRTIMQYRNRIDTSLMGKFDLVGERKV